MCSAVAAAAAVVVEAVVGNRITMFDPVVVGVDRTDFLIVPIPVLVLDSDSAVVEVDRIDSYCPQQVVVSTSIDHQITLRQVLIQTSLLHLMLQYYLQTILLPAVAAEAGYSHSCLYSYFRTKPHWQLVPGLRGPSRMRKA